MKERLKNKNKTSAIVFKKTRLKMLPKNQFGTVYIPLGLDPELHERRTAELLVKYLGDIEFLVPKRQCGVSDPDILNNGIIWEMKSPKSGHRKGVLQNISRALYQSRNIIIDVRRVKSLPDSEILNAIENEIIFHKCLERLIFIGHQKNVILFTPEKKRKII